MGQGPYSKVFEVDIAEFHYVEGPKDGYNNEASMYNTKRLRLARKDYEMTSGSMHAWGR